MKIVIEAGAEVTLKAGGSFVKVDPSGVTVSGPLVRMNSGGGAGSGSGVGTQTPAKPALVAEHDSPEVEHAELALASQRLSASGAKLRAPLLKQAAREGALSVTNCEFDEHGRCKLHQHT